jgi:hypothetical protein
MSYLVKDPQSHIKEVKIITRSELTLIYASEEALSATSDVTFVTCEDDEISLPKLYTLLCNQMRGLREQQIDVKFLPVASIDFECDEGGTRIVCKDPSWCTVIVNIEFVYPLLYYCEYEIQNLYQYHFIMFGFVDKTNTTLLNKSCLSDVRFYGETLPKRMKVGSKVSIYVDYRGTSKKMHMFIDDEYVDTQFGVIFPGVPALSITRSDNVIKLNPRTFIPVHSFYHQHVLPINQDK